MFIQVTALKIQKLFSLLISASVFIACFHISENTIQTELHSESFNDAIDPYCNGLSYDTYYELTKKNILDLEVDIYQSKNFYEDVAEAYYVGNFINKDYKTPYKGEVKVNYKNGIYCVFSSEIRIHGDWKDHVDIHKLIASLDVKLLEGNILGITNFKLLIPITRNADNEIFLTTLLQEFDVITPRTFYLEVDLNGFGKHKYIFQEKATKELIENIGLREGPILETDETYIWNNTENKYFRNLDLENSTQFMFAKYLNKAWVLRNEDNSYLTEKAISLFNRAIYSSKNYPTFNSESDGFKNLQNQIYETILLVTNSDHGLITHNRKFYYNPFDEQFYPIYYDGMSFFSEEEIKNLATKFKNPNLVEALDYLINTEINIDSFYESLISNGYNEEKWVAEKLIKKYYTNLAYYSKLPLLEEVNIIEKDDNNFPLILSADFNYLISHMNLNYLETENRKNIYFSTGKETVECSEFEECIYSEILLSELLRENNKKNIFFGNKEIFLFGQELRNKFEYEVDNFLVTSNQEVNFETNYKQKKIDLHISNNNQEIVIISSKKIENWTFNLFIDSNLPRNDSSYITGCLTLYNVELLNTSFNINNSNCEDALNIISSSGKVENIKIINSRSDGLDIDFSNLEIKDVYIDTAGNDCIDLSSGDYTLSLVKTENCNDKAVSIGEHSNVKIHDFEIQNSFTGLAIKDSSFAKINIVKTDNIKNCILAYRKKQEFGPSKLELIGESCNDNYKIQLGSTINFLTND